MSSRTPDVWWFIAARSLFIAAPAWVLHDAVPTWLALFFSVTLLALYSADARLSSVRWDASRLQLRKGPWVRWELNWEQVCAVGIEEFYGARTVVCQLGDGSSETLIGFSWFSLTPRHQRELVTELQRQLRNSRTGA